MGCPAQNKITCDLTEDPKHSVFNGYYDLIFANNPAQNKITCDLTEEPKHPVFKPIFNGYYNLTSI